MLLNNTTYATRYPLPQSPARCALGFGRTVTYVDSSWRHFTRTADFLDLTLQRNLDACDAGLWSFFDLCWVVVCRTFKMADRQITHLSGRQRWDTATWMVFIKHFRQTILWPHGKVCIVAFADKHTTHWNDTRCSYFKVRILFTSFLKTFKDMYHISNRILWNSFSIKQHSKENNSRFLLKLMKDLIYMYIKMKQSQFHQVVAIWIFRIYMCS